MHSDDPYCFDESHFIFKSWTGQLSQFDLKFRQLWDEKDAKKIFQYSYQDVVTKRLLHEHLFRAEFYVNRSKKRTAQFTSSVTMPFNPDLFHFGKVSQEEILFEIIPKHWQKEECKDRVAKHMILINSYPIGYGSSLLVPSLDNHLPQIMTFESLRLAAEIMLVSHDTQLRLGFNSLGGHASVNHLHFHLYIIEGIMDLQFRPAKKLIGDCYELLTFPSKGFVFQLTEKETVLAVIHSIMKLINFLQTEQIPHNILMTRGLALAEEPSEILGFLDAVRIFVFPRKSCFGVKSESALNVAFCELTGHLVIADKDVFENITDNQVISMINDTCQDVLENIRQDVINLYS